MARKIIIINVSRPDRAPGSPLLGIAVRLLRALGYRFTTVSEAMRGAADRYACLTVDGGARPVMERMRPYLARLGVPATIFACVSDLGAADWTALKSLRAAGWEVGSAGLGPVNLTELSYGDQQASIASSRQIFADALGEAPKLFSYPFGAYDATTVSCVKDAGFEAALTCTRGVNAGSEADAYHLRRLGLASGSIRDMTTLVKHALVAAPLASGPVLPNAATPRRRVRSGAVS